ncbi:MAG TPA: DUF2905 family protein [Candidatus Kapabacteria bacterium]|jgi:hypothetical protein|nr:DUF2905 family protein [Candidatus Kapabacteria bacterium]
MQTQQLALTNRASIARHQEPPAISWRGILVGLWLTCTLVILVSLLPGVGFSLGNLPGDIDAGSHGGSVRVPLATIALLLVTLTGIYYRVSSYLSRH